MKHTLLLTLLSFSLAGASVAPISVTSVARSSNVVTVTCGVAACGLAANQGFSLNGVTDSTYNQDGTVVTTSGNTFTFSQTGSNSSSSGGTVAPQNQIVILKVDTDTNGLLISGLFWIATSSGVPVGTGSVWTGASTQAVNAIKAGLIIERQFSQQYGATTSKATIQSDILSQYTAFQSAQNASAVQPGQFYGGTYNGGWSF